MASYCGACGAGLRTSDKFCAKCGEKTKNNIEEEYVEEKQAPQKYLDNKYEDKKLEEKEQEDTKYDDKKIHLVKLVEEFKIGNDNAFGEFYQLTKNYMFYSINKILSDRDAVEDLVQESYLAIYHNIASLKESKSILSWMGTIAQNKAYNYLRKNKRVVLLEENSILLENEEVSDHALLPEEAMQNKEVQRLLKKILEELPEMQKLAVIAFYYNEMSVEETAKALDIPVGTVKTNLYRARAKIKVSVEELASKKNTKLYSVSIAPLLLLLFSEEAKACEIPSTTYSSIMNAITKPKAVKTVGRAMKASVAKKLVIAALAAGTLAGSVGVVSYLFDSTPEKTLMSFENSYNKQDIEGMVECLEPEVQRIYNGILSAVSGITGINPQDILDTVIGTVNELNSDEPYELDIIVRDISYTDGSVAKVDTTLIFLNGNDREEVNFVIPMQKIGRHWYIDFN